MGEGFAGPTFHHSCRNMSATAGVSGAPPIQSRHCPLRRKEIRGKKLERQNGCKIDNVECFSFEENIC